MHTHIAMLLTHAQQRYLLDGRAVAAAACATDRTVFVVSNRLIAIIGRLTSYLQLQQQLGQ